MSTKENVVSTAVTPSSIHVETAQALLEQLRQMREVIPHFAIPASLKERTRLNSAASVPAEFVELTTVAQANEKSLVRGDGMTPAESRDLASYANAYSPVADELEALAHFVRYSVRVARNRRGSEALMTYALAQRLAKRPETAHLAPYVADMRRALGRMRKLTAEERKLRAAAKAPKLTDQPS